jgi:hypothetical protein
VIDLLGCEGCELATWGTIIEKLVQDDDAYEAGSMLVIAEHRLRTRRRCLVLDHTKQKV